DAGTVNQITKTLEDGSVRINQITNIDLTCTFFSTDPAHTGVVTAHPEGPFIETDHPDGSITLRAIGSNGHVTIPGQGIVYASQGITRIEIDASGNVTEVSHGNFSPDHSGVCPLL